MKLNRENWTSSLTTIQATELLHISCKMNIMDSKLHEWGLTKLQSKPHALKQNNNSWKCYQAITYKLLWNSAQKKLRSHLPNSSSKQPTMSYNMRKNLFKMRIWLKITSLCSKTLLKILCLWKNQGRRLLILAVLLCRKERLTSYNHPETQCRRVMKRKTTSSTTLKIQRLKISRAAIESSKRKRWKREQRLTSPNFCRRKRETCNHRLAVVATIWCNSKTSSAKSCKIKTGKNHFLRLPLNSSAPNNPLPLITKPTSEADKPVNPSNNPKTCWPSKPKNL